MRKAFSWSTGLLCSWLLCGCAALRSFGGGPAPANQYQQLADNVWMHTSYRNFVGLGALPSNGLLVRAQDGLYLIDTAWNDAQTEAVLQWAQRTLNAPVKAAILTHAHVDKMGGVAALHRAGVETWAHPLSNQDAPARDLVPAKRSLQLQENIQRMASGSIEVMYPGPGHTRDNIVVYLGASKILFGGCMIRPGNSANLGNTADADLSRWASSVRAVQARYPQIKTVIPSHGPPSGPRLLQHTISLVQARAHARRHPTGRLAHGAPR